MPKPKGKSIVKKPLQIKPDYRDGMSVQYSNFASVYHTPIEIGVDFCLLLPPYKIEENESNLKAPIFSRILMSTQMAERLCEAIKTELNKLETEKKDAEKKEK